jgi:hypothetical protein
MLQNIKILNIMGLKKEMIKEFWQTYELDNFFSALKYINIVD